MLNNIVVSIDDIIYFMNRHYQNIIRLSKIRNIADIVSNSHAMIKFGDLNSA